VFPDSNVSWVASAAREDGSPAVLKLNFPEAETEHEPDAFRHWAGHMAVRLIADDPEHRALLLEHCDPGIPLREADEPSALHVGAEVLRSFRRPAPESIPFQRLDEAANHWRAEIPRRWERLGRPFEGALIDFAIDQIDRLVGTGAESVVLHQDLHSGNILSSDRGWPAIDPKPLVGDPAFDAASMLRDRRDELEHDVQPGRVIRTRLDTLTRLLELDRERLRGWGVVHALAWGVDEDGFDEVMVACARWLAEAT